MPVNSNTLPAAQLFVHNVEMSASSQKAAGLSDTQSSPLAGVHRYTSASVMLEVTQMTASTLNVWLQKRLPDDSNWIDIASFDQLSAAGNRLVEITAAGNAQHTPTDGSLAAGTVLTVNLGEEWSLSFSVGNAGGGTANFAVWADFFA